MNFIPPPRTPRKSLLQLEELAELLLAVFAFAHLPYAWWGLPAASLLPDLSMLGYLAGPRVGAASYNLAHRNALGLAGWGLGLPLVVLAGPILLFHSSFDRLLGYGLKYSTSFQDTHPGRVSEVAGPVASPPVA